MAHGFELRRAPVGTSNDPETTNPSVRELRIGSLLHGRVAFRHRRTCRCATLVGCYASPIAKTPRFQPHGAPSARQGARCYSTVGTRNGDTLPPTGERPARRSM